MKILDINKKIVSFDSDLIKSFEQIVTSQEQYQ